MRELLWPAPCVAGKDQAQAPEETSQKALCDQGRGRHRVRPWHRETEDAAAAAHRRAGRASGEDQRIHIQDPSVRGAQQLLQDRSGRHLHEDEGRLHDEWTAQARLQPADRCGLRIYHLADRFLASYGYKNAEAVPPADGK